MRSRHVDESIRAQARADRGERGGIVAGRDDRPKRSCMPPRNKRPTKPRHPLGLAALALRELSRTIKSGLQKGDRFESSGLCISLSLLK